MRKDYQYIKRIRIEGKKVHIVFADKEDLEITCIWFTINEMKEIMNEIEKKLNEF